MAWFSLSNINFLEPGATVGLQGGHQADKLGIELEQLAGNHTGELD